MPADLIRVEDPAADCSISVSKHSLSKSQREMWLPRTDGDSRAVLSCVLRERHASPQRRKRGSGKQQQQYERRGVQEAAEVVDHKRVGFLGERELVNMSEVGDG